MSMHHDSKPATPDRLRTTRRSFLASSAALTGTTAVGTSLGSVIGASPAAAAETGPLTAAARADRARAIRIASADFQRRIPLPDHPSNDDERVYADRSRSYTKALAHTDDGLVVPAAYSAYLAALASGKYSDLDVLAVGPRRLVNPLAAYAYGPEGADSHAFALPSAPASDSARTQGEMAELYWMALARDIPFDLYAKDGTDIIASAVSDLSQKFSDVQMVKTIGPLTPQTIFRDLTADSLSGNFVSQYLLQTVPWGVQDIVQTGRRRPFGFDQMTTVPSWLAVQKGTIPPSQAFDGNRGYLRSGRDLAEWVHGDFPQQAVLNAARIIAGQGNRGDAKVSPGINDQVNPYATSKNEAVSRSMTGFVTFGNQAFFDLVCRVGQLAMQAAWYQKWLVHRRLRPEEYGGRVNAALGGSTPSSSFLPELQASLSDPARLGRVKSKWGSLLLPQTYVEGSPTHPAYPSGHSTFVAAGVTMIKAFVDGTVAVANPQQVGDPNNGDTLTAYTGSAALTINGELDKLVMNVGVGRLFAGVHWRSDHYLGRQLGELVAVRALQDLSRNYAEYAVTGSSFPGWDLRLFNGTTVKVGPDSVKKLDGTEALGTNQVS